MTARFDPKDVTAAELADLTDPLFRSVVDADLRRRVYPDNLLAETARALRSPAHIERWHATLEGIRQSVEGQLRATADEYEAQHAALETNIQRVETEGGNPARLERLYDEESRMRTDYLAKRASRERFLTGVNEHLVQAESLRNEHRASRQDSAVVEERDRLQARVIELERAIETHRKAVLIDLSEDEEPELYEESLWAVLAVSDG